MERRHTRTLVALVLGTLVAGLIWATLASAGRNQYHVDSVTIRVDRAANTLSGKVIADSVDGHFCTSQGSDWPVKIRRVLPGRDRVVASTRANPSSEWRVVIRSNALQGKRVYAQVPSFPNTANGYCNGARSRTVRAP
jgi:hypothetical protein